MKRVYQTIIAPPTGNCLAACIASLLELPIWLVPNFGAASHNGNWFGLLSQFMTDNGRGTMLLPCNSLEGSTFEMDDGLGDLAKPPPFTEGWTMSGSLARGLGILTIKSRRGDWNHCVVANLLTGRIVHDPAGDQFLGMDYRPIDWMIFPRLAVLRVGKSPWTPTAANP